MFNKFLSDKTKALRGGDKERRPYLATECRDLNACDKWRQEILREIGKKVLEIQNAGLGEHRLRDLNDEINKLIREKGHWERQILSLGGPNYVAQSTNDSLTSTENSSSQNQKGGYKYFGAAKELPGVKQLFETPKQRVVRKTRHQLNKSIDADYYGFRDEEDGVLLREERDASKRLREAKCATWDERKRIRTELGGAATTPWTKTPARSSHTCLCLKKHRSSSLFWRRKRKTCSRSTPAKSCKDSKGGRRRC